MTRSSDKGPTARCDVVIVGAGQLAEFIRERWWADITWRAGVDVLSFGSTKNGTLHPVETNLVFARLSKAAQVRLRARGFRFLQHDDQTARLVTSFDSADSVIDLFIETVVHS